MDKISYKAHLRNAVEHMCVSWISVKGKLYFSYVGEWNYN
jgi:hypothetical protein